MFVEGEKTKQVFSTFSENPKIRNFGLTSNYHDNHQGRRLVKTLKKKGIEFDPIDFPISGVHINGIIFANSSKKGTFLF